jgi:hypothetical protein
MPPCLDCRLTDGGDGFGLKRRPIFIPLKIPVTQFCYRLRKPPSHTTNGKVRNMEKSVTSQGSEPVSFRLVAECLKRVQNIIITAVRALYPAQLLLNCYTVTMNCRVLLQRFYTPTYICAFTAISLNFEEWCLLGRYAVWLL